MAQWMSGSSPEFTSGAKNIDLSALKFRGDEGMALNGILGAAFLLVVIVAAGIFAFFYMRRRRWAEEVAEQREEARLKLMVSELNLGRTEVQLLQTLTGGGDTADLLELLETRDKFEAAVQSFRDAHPADPALRRMAQLRQRLEYGFDNVRNPFVDTRMLAPGTRLRCRIKTAKREVSFLTTLMGVNERQFIIRPPTAKGKPVSIGGLRELQFRVSREHDAEYEFDCPVEGQLPTGTRAIICGHTRTISRLLFRNADRIDVEIPTEFYVIRQEFTNERTASHLRALDSQYRIDGVIRDISIGGALVVSQGKEERVHEGDMIVFKLPAAQIKDDVVGQCMGLFPRDDDTTQIHLQFMGLRELNRLKLGKFLVSLKKEGAAYSSGTKLAQSESVT
jgi:PilZ domain